MITLICGRCRAGKTTYSRKFSNVVHLDTAAKSGRERYQSVLRMIPEQSGDVVVEGIYDTAEKRMALLDAYVGEDSKCIWLDTDPETISRRMGMAFGPWRHHPVMVPREFEPPTYTEGWDEIIVIRGDQVDTILSDQG